MVKIFTKKHLVAYDLNIRPLGELCIYWIDYAGNEIKLKEMNKR
ncbi:hypothetical protein [Paenibacillus aestuarii]|uniref:Uncharacterized protein n=1 Tax=Paenibacillus aestuarii TaxID=516965 RepID=A0ABW0KF37_9BACL|nr:hypothetical protein [Paenibacillus aestuarii]